MAWLQPRISKFLSDNANKDNSRPCAPCSKDAEKTSNLSPQDEKVPLLKKSIPEAEGTAKMVWSIVKLNTTSTSPLEPQNPSNFSEVACSSVRRILKRGRGARNLTKFEKHKGRKEHHFTQN